MIYFRSNNFYKMKMDSIKISQRYWLLLSLFIVTRAQKGKMSPTSHLILHFTLSSSRSWNENEAKVCWWNEQHHSGSWSRCHFCVHRQWNTCKIIIKKQEMFEFYNNLKGYRVGWVNANSKAIQAIGTHVITHNTRWVTTRFYRN